MRVAWLDYARAFAAFSVLSFHYLAGTGIDFGLARDMAQYGYLGVQLFFMISGFVISSSMEGKTPREFVAGRLLRIYPTFVVCMTITAFVLFVIQGPQLPAAALQYLANLAVNPHVFGMPYIDGVYWTLALEFEFYAAIAVLMLLGVADRPAIWHPLWVAAIVLGMVLHVDTHAPLIGSYFAFFAAGAVIYDMRKRGTNLLHIGLLGTLAAVTVYSSVGEVAFLAVDRGHSLLGWYVLAIVALFFVLFLVFEAADARGWRPPQAKLLGLMTYPLYLLHAQIGFVAFWLVGAAAPWQTYAATTVLISGLALLVAGVIEPAIRPGWKRAIDAVVGLALPSRKAPGEALPDAAMPRNVGEMVPPPRFERGTPRSTI